MKRILLILLVLLTASAAARADYFPVDLDVHTKHGILLPNRDGLFLYQPSTGKVSLLHSPQGSVPVFARFAPSGKEVLAVVNEAKGFENKLRVDLVPLDSGPVRTLFRADRACDLQFAPDGTHIAFMAVVENFPNVYELRLVEVASGKVRTLWKGKHGQSRWFADSRRLLVVTGKEAIKERSRRFSAQIAALDVSDGKLTPLAAVCIGNDHHIALSPDNKKVLFTAFAADKADAQPALPKEEKSTLFELDLKTLALRGFDKEAEFVRYSPGGKKVLLTVPGEGIFGGMKQPLEVADADLKTFKKIAADSYAPAIHFDSEGLVLPGWLDEENAYYITPRRVYGVDNMAMHMVLIGADGQNRRLVQPDIDDGMLRELTKVSAKPKTPTRLAFADVRKRREDAKILAALKKLGVDGFDGEAYCSISLKNENLTDNKQLQPEVLKLLGGLSRVALRGAYLSEAGIAELRSVQGLRRLELPIDKSSRPGLAHLKGYTQLRELELFAGADDALDDTALENVKNLTNLVHLRVDGHQITDKGLAHLQDLTNLKLLDLNRNRLTGKSLAHLARLTNLENLGMSDNQITDAGLRDLKDLPLSKLQSLDLSRNQLDGKRLAWLKGMIGLEILYLNDNEMGDLASLSGLPKLRELYLRNSDASDESLIHLKTLAALVTLDLGNTLVGDAGLKTLSGLPRLEVLRLEGTAVTDAGLLELAKMPRLVRVSVPRRVTNEAIERLKKQLPKLEVEKN